MGDNAAYIYTKMSAGGQREGGKPKGRKGEEASERRREGVGAEGGRRDRERERETKRERER